MKITWFDWWIYRLFHWRWKRILENRPDMRELMIATLKAYDTLDAGEQVKITIEKVHPQKITRKN